MLWFDRDTTDFVSLMIIIYHNFIVKKATFFCNRIVFLKCIKTLTWRISVWWYEISFIEKFNRLTYRPLKAHFHPQRRWGIDKITILSIKCIIWIVIYVMVLKLGLACPNVGVIKKLYKFPPLPFSCLCVFSNMLLCLVTCDEINVLFFHNGTLSILIQWV